MEDHGNAHMDMDMAPAMVRVIQVFWEKVQAGLRLKSVEFEAIIQT